MGIAVEVGDEIQGLVAQIVRDAMPSVLPRMEAEAQAIVDAAVARWPYEDRTGKRAYRDRKGHPHSRDLFRVETQITANAAEVRVINSAAYLYKIKSEQNGLGGKSAWVELIRKPARAVAKELAEDLAVDLAKLAKGA